MSELYGHCRLHDLGVFGVRGRDAVAFLQGQLSQDVAQLDAVHARFAGYHNPQGRVIAILRLLRTDDGVGCVLPRELVAPVAERLRRYVLRAKLTLTDDSEDTQVIGEARDGSRVLRLVPSGDSTILPGPPIARAAWHAFDIAAGLPQVYRATSEAFVAQMLNLDLVDGIAFDKGCYTGQEIIARAHYRGRVKRRMQRFRTRAPGAVALVPASAVTLADGRTAQVIDAVTRLDGRIEFLAVAPFGEGGGAPATHDPPPESHHPQPVAIDVEALPLPYALPA